ncbi:hypothetical protein HUG10_10060 [Halorarum halophilum]|uniref:Uncharacterized protein n=1 Tax=Halorarum halophilum TaxID=2743090 RepID=A0A7D5KLZ8_9EURY|nr:hypothetical protein [Halobaculum halophilum]QLG27875.1 hypothetical protein HUG10_10060 [Halobaculum halophilum]
MTYILTSAQGGLDFGGFFTTPTLYLSALITILILYKIIDNFGDFDLSNQQKLAAVSVVAIPISLFLTKIVLGITALRTIELAIGAYFSLMFAAGGALREKSLPWIAITVPIPVAALVTISNSAGGMFIVGIVTLGLVSAMIGLVLNG